MPHDDASAPTPDHGHLHGHGHGHGQNHGHAGHAPDALAIQTSLLDLDAEVLADHLDEVTGWVAATVGDAAVPTRVLDLGAGTGTGTFALARRFPGAAVVAVDGSPEMLAHLEGKADALGLSGRVSTAMVDLDAEAADWPAIEPVDLAWAAHVVHHVVDPDRLLRTVLAGLRPGGAFVMVEMDALPRYLPDDLGLGEPGLGDRMSAALDAAARDRGALPHEPSLTDAAADWGSRLRTAGFTDTVEHEFVVEVDGEPTPALRRLARGWIERTRETLAERLGADDVATLDLLLGDGPESLDHRGDLVVRTIRRAWLGLS